MTTFHIPLLQLQIFFIIFARVAAIVMSIPVFSTRNVPVLVKVGLAFSISVILIPIVSLEHKNYFDSVISFAIGVTGEVILGVAIGLFVKMIFAGIQLAGQLAGYQMGLAIANVLAPDSSAQMPLISQVYQVAAVLVFLSINAHYLFLGAMIESFHIVPPFQFQLNSSLVEQIIGFGSGIFVTGLKIGAPVVAVLLFTSVAFGLIARTVPQMNVFIVAIPLKIGVGLLFIIFSLPYFTSILKQTFASMQSGVLSLLMSMK